MSKIINGIEIPELTVYQNLEERNKKNLPVPSIEIYGNSLTYKEFFEEVETYTKAFAEMGIKKGDSVTLCMPGIPEFVIAYYALNKMGANANGVSIGFLKDNLKRYTDDKKSDTLVIFDKFYGLIHDQVANTNLKNVIITDITGYMPELAKSKFSNEDMLDTFKCNGLVLPDNIEYIRMKEFISAGEHSNKIVLPAEYDENRNSTYLYSSGTTGNPKCVVFKDYAINALVNMHDSIDLNEEVGDRSLLIIPPYYATSLLYAINLQLCKGKTLVFQPVYNKYTFAEDLKNLKINHTVAAASHYVAAISNGLEKGDLKNLKFPGCGGEGIPRPLAKTINEKLHYYGAKESLVIGGGTSELGSSVFAAYNLEGRTNETGFALPGVKTKIINPITGEEVKDGERGEMIVSSPNAMSHYYGDPEETEKYFTEEDGYKWGHPKDIAVKNEDGSYTMLGRGSDSYEKDGKRIYLFDSEEKISEYNAVLECEAVALPLKNNKYAQVIHVVLDKNFTGNPSEVISKIQSMVDVDGIKIINAFGTSEITGKRNTKILLKDREGFYLEDKNGNYVRIDFPINEEIKTTNITSEKLNNETIKVLKRKK